MASGAQSSAKALASQLASARGSPPRMAEVMAPRLAQTTASAPTRPMKLTTMPTNAWVGPEAPRASTHEPRPCVPSEIAAVNETQR